MTKVMFKKTDVVLWSQHSPFITAELFKNPETFVMVFNSGRELAWELTTDGRALKPNRDSTGYREWLDLPYGSLVEAELV